MTPVEMPGQLPGTPKKVSLPRVAFYSHDTQGLGHIRRNLAIATALQSCAVPPVTLLISGTQLGAALGKPAGVDFLTLPAVAKDGNGRYYAHSLALSLDEIINLRAATIQSTLAAFAPDVLIVDKTPTGLKDELLPALQHCVVTGGHAVCSVCAMCWMIQQQHGANGMTPTIARLSTVSTMQSGSMAIPLFTTRCKNTI
jgi:predicted glycosyltransferase